jgi:hypothetical protein
VAGAVIKANFRPIKFHNSIHPSPLDHPKIEWGHTQKIMAGVLLPEGSTGVWYLPSQVSNGVPSF